MLKALPVTVLSFVVLSEGKRLQLLSAALVLIP
jgi:hypothetical protein